MYRVYFNWWRFEFHRHTYIKIYNHLNQNLNLVFAVVVLVFVRQGRELAAYHPTCLKVGDKTWQRSTQDDWKLRTGLTACHPRCLKVNDKILHCTILYNPRWLKVKEKACQHSIKHVWKLRTESYTVTSKMLDNIKHVWNLRTRPDTVASKVFED